MLLTHIKLGKEGRSNHPRHGQPRLLGEIRLRRLRHSVYITVRLSRDQLTTPLDSLRDSLSWGFLFPPGGTTDLLV